MPTRRKRPLYPVAPSPKPVYGVWKDVSSFGQHDTDRTPKSFDLCAGPNIRLSVHRHIYHAPDVWVTHCEPFWRERELESKDLVAAQSEAVAKLRGVLNEALAALP